MQTTARSPSSAGRQSSIITSALFPFAHEDVVPACRDITPILQPANVHVLGAHLALQTGCAFLVHVGIFQMAGKLDGNPDVEVKQSKNENKRDNLELFGLYFDSAFEILANFKSRGAHIRYYKVKLRIEFKCLHTY